MKALLRFISNDDCWVIEQDPSGSLKLYRNCQFPSMNTLTFVSRDMGTLIGLLQKFEQKLAEQPK